MLTVKDNHTKEEHKIPLTDIVDFLDGSDCCCDDECNCKKDD